jgi:hypothetical protein
MNSMPSFAATTSATTDLQRRGSAERQKLLETRRLAFEWPVPALRPRRTRRIPERSYR